jgi:hypothetical protein
MWVLMKDGFDKYTNICTLFIMLSKICLTLNISTSVFKCLRPICTKSFKPGLSLKPSLKP